MGQFALRSLLNLTLEPKGAANEPTPSVAAGLALRGHPGFSVSQAS